MNTLLLFLSEYKESQETNYYKTENDNFETSGNQTNDASVKYVNKLLSPENEKIDRIIYICSERVLKEELSIINLHEIINNEDVIKNPIDISDSPTQSEIFEVTNSIASLLKPNDNLYIDITGGFRDTIMIMLSIIRSIKVRGINAKKIIYVNFNRGSTPEKPNIIYDRVGAYNIFDLISGIDEFINYGSVRKINEYYKNSPDMAINKVLDKLNGFSNALILCQSKHINNKIKNLYTAIDESEKGVKDPVYLLMVGIIKENFERTVEPESSILDIILWCVEKELVMQALTFYIEIVVDYFFKKKIISMSANIRKLVIENKKNRKKEYYSPELYFFTAYLLGWKLEDSDENKIKIKLSDLNPKIDEKRMKEITKDYEIIRRWRNDIFHGKEYTKPISELCKKITDSVNRIKKYIN